MILYFKKIGWYHFETYSWYMLHKKLPFRHWENGKWFFREKKVENLLRQHCLPRKDVYVCTIWAHSDKRFHGSDHNIGICHEVHETSNKIGHLWEHFLKIFAILQVCYFFLETRSHTMTQCEGFKFFWFFLNFLCLIQNTVKTAGLRGIS